MPALAACWNALDVETVGDRAHVLAGVGTNDTAHSIENARSAVNVRSPGRSAAGGAAVSREALPEESSGAGATGPVAAASRAGGSMPGAMRLTFLVCLAGIEDITIGETIADHEHRRLRLRCRP